MVIGRQIKGKYRSIKTRYDLLLLAIFVILPFVRVGGDPLFLLDIPARKFHIFGLTIFPQELIFLNLLLAMAGVALFLFTAMFGRVWCAYGCPQSVLTDLYDWVGRALNGKKYGKKSATIGHKIILYFGWTILSLVVAYLFISFFVDYKETLPKILSFEIFGARADGSTAPWVKVWMFISAFALGVWGGFRENACKYVCPYGRFQTALLDAHSPIVAYNKKRGEPRRQKGQQEFEGDCTACNMCVLVCPTGIDIREGLQVGCIACGLCVDACTIEMDRKWQKPTLIDFRTIAQVDNPDTPKKLWRGRTLVYSAMMILLIGFFIFRLAERVPLYASVNHDRAIYSVEVPGVGYQNGYMVKVGNMSDKEVTVKVELISGNPDFKFDILNEVNEVKIPAAGYKNIRFIVRLNTQENHKGRKGVPLTYRIVRVDDASMVKEVKSNFSFPRK